MPKIYSLDLKISVIAFYNSDLFTIENCLYIFNISKSTLYNWINLNKQNDLQIISNKRNNYNSKITNEIQKYIITYVSKRNIFSTKNLRKCISRIFNVNISKSSIYRILKINNITNKKVTQKIIPKKINNKEKINELLQKVKLIDSNQIISIDESSFDTHMNPNYGWSKKGNKITKIFNTPRRIRKTLTLAVSKNKIIGYNIINGASNTQNFKNFLENKILPNITNGAILIDNVCFHHSKVIKNLVESTSNIIIYNVPYNPETNPIEFVFSIIKNYVRKENFIKNINIDNLITSSFKYITSKKLKHIFNHSIKI